MSRIANQGFGGKRLSNKKRKKRGNKTTPVVIFIIVAIGLYFLFRDSNTNTTPEDVVVITPETTEEMTKETTRTTSTPVNNVTTIPISAVTTPVNAVTPQGKATITDRQRVALTSLYQKSKTALSQGDLILSKELAFQILPRVTEGSKPWNQAAVLIGTANTLIFTTDYITDDKVNHIVKTGDSLDKIVKQYSTTLEAIQRSNKLSKSSSTIRLGQSLTVFKGEWSIRISKSTFKLQLFNKGKLFKVYKIATGKGNKTPEGAFVIAAKIKEPEWTNNGVKYPFGTPENVLGTRWMKLRAAASNPNKHLKGYGIHGTWDPSSLGKMASNGCIRMMNKDVEELFSIIPKYSNPNGNLVPVEIVR